MGVGGRADAREMVAVHGEDPAAGIEDAVGLAIKSLHIKPVDRLTACDKING